MFKTCKDSPCGVMISTTLHTIIFAALVFLAIQNYYMHKSLKAYENYAITRDKEWNEAFKWRDKIIVLVENEAETIRQTSLESRRLLTQMIEDLKKK